MLVKERNSSTNAVSVIEEPNAETSAAQETELNDGTGDAQMSVFALPFGEFSSISSTVEIQS